MASSYLLIYLVVFACSLVMVIGRPSSNESSLIEDEMIEVDSNKEQKSISYLTDSEIENANIGTRDIVEKIKAINNNLKKPHRTTVNFNNPHSNEDYVVDNELLQKIKHLIATNKLQTVPRSRELEEPEEDVYIKRDLNSRNTRLISSLGPNSVPVMQVPYSVGVPLLYMPNNDISSRNIGLDYRQSNNIYQTRQDQSSFLGFPPFSFPSLQNFQFTWPFANAFPVLIKDPLVAITQGGGWNNFIEYGQSADVCNRKQKSIDDKEASENEIVQDIIQQLQDSASRDNKEIDEDNYNRDARVLRKHTTNSNLAEKRSDTLNDTKTIFFTKPTAAKTPAKSPSKLPNIFPTRTKTRREEGDLRLPFSDYTALGNRKPIAPSPGFFINKLRVRKGGVAIAGPGGVATAGNGGTAIVGAGGLAYTKPGGLAVAGPDAHVVALPADSDFSAVLSQLQKINGTLSQPPKPVRQGKFSEPVMRLLKNQEDNPDVYNYDGQNFVSQLSEDPKFTFLISPRSFAFSGINGTAISNPISRVILRPGDVVTIIHDPKATAVAGPGGIAHAESELEVIEYKKL